MLMLLNSKSVNITIHLLCCFPSTHFHAQSLQEFNGNFNSFDNTGTEKHLYLVLLAVKSKIIKI